MELAAAGVILGLLATYALVVIIWYVLSVIAYWKIFTKAGEEGWKSIIPIYNSYVQYRITWDVKFFWISIAVSVVGALLGYLGDAMSMLGSAFLFAAWVINILALHKMSKAYGHGVGFTVGLVLLNPIFLLILGFGKSEYQGPQ